MPDRPRAADDGDAAYDATSEARDVIARIRAGDRDAFEAVAVAHYARLVRHAYRYVRDLSAAEDIVQDTLLRLWVGRAQLVVQNSIVSYLFRAVRNHALNYVRHQHVEERRDRALLADETLAGVSDPGVSAVTNLTLRGLNGDDATFEACLAAVQEAVAALPERQAEAFGLRIEQELSFAEIAEVMGLSLRSAQTTYLRAVQFLRTRLAPYYER
jgi:RNA polymerase sigma-70 factor (ECF subfamily)